jgi:translation initiation factor 6 (eIF-6)
MTYTLDTKVGELLRDTHAVEVLEKYVPGVSQNPMIGMASAMTIKSLLAMPQAQQYGITEEKVMQVLKEINART